MLENPFLYSLAITLIHFIWQGGLIALCLKLALVFISQRKSQLRYALASVAMLASLVVPLSTFFMIYHVDLDLLSSKQLITTELVNRISPIIEQDVSANLVEYLPFISLLWLVSICYLAIKLVFELRFVHQLVRVDIIATEQPLARRFAQLASQLNLSRMPRLLVSLKAEIPMAVGWLKPVVLLPVSMIAGLSAAQLEMLLLHELAHIQRHDYLVNFVQTLVEILFFFHPAVRWISTQMRNEREFCSDDIAVHHCCKPIAYARTLTETAALCQKKHHQSIPQMALAASGGDLKQRVVRLVNQHCTPSNNVSKWFAALFIMVSVLMISTQQFTTMPLLTDNVAYLPFYSNQQLTASKNSPIQPLNLNKAPLAHHLLNDRIPSSSVISQTLATHVLSLDDNILESKIKKKAEDTKTTVNNNFEGKIKPIKLNVFASKTPLKKPAINSFDGAKVGQAKTTTISKQSTINNKQKVSQANNTAKQHQLYSLLSKRFEPKSQQRVTEVRMSQQDIFEQFKSPETRYSRQIAELSRLTDQSGQTAKAASITTVAHKQYKKPVKKIAQLISSFDPKYPSSAKRNKIELEVLVHFSIDATGYVHDIVFEPQDKVSYFRRSIRSAMRKWRFEPAQVNGQAVKSKMSKIFSFTLAD